MANFKNATDVRAALIYRGSRDGFSGSNYNVKIDKINPTLTLIKSSRGRKFGGFAS